MARGDTMPSKSWSGCTARLIGLAVLSVVDWMTLSPTQIQGLTPHRSWQKPSPSDAGA